ncbi:MAG: hypothetical protein ACRDHD_09130 [Candidatus Limnocylindria bacterium]
MSRFDDDLRGATGPLAGEPLPDGILDEALDGAPRREPWPALVGAMAAVLLLVAGISAAGLLPPAAERSPTPSPSSSAAAACEDVAPPGGGADVVFITFPCGVEEGGQASGARSVPFGLSAEDRLERAIRALLDGPSPLEQQQGMRPVLSSGSAEILRSVRLQPDGLAQIDFVVAPVLGDMPTLVGSEFADALRATALPMPEVTALELQLNGSCDALFGDSGSTCRHLAEPVELAPACPLITPDELPSGAAVLEPRPYPGEPMVSWGSGADTVTLRPGDQGDAPPAADGRQVDVRGFTGYAVALDPGPGVGLSWVEDGCPYLVRLARQVTLEQAVGYAARLGRAVSRPDPTRGPGTSISGTVERDGIRMTLELDRSRTSFEERVWAELTIENIGPDSIFWGHSGTCAWAGQVLAVPEDRVPVPYGRTDWPGELGILKNITVLDRAPDLAFAPEAFVDSEGTMGCTTDYVSSELPPGEVIRSRFAWDSVGVNGMPARPGTYAAVATFTYEGRGSSRPINPAAPPEVAIQLPLAVDGTDAPALAPGQAVDAVLADSRFTSYLANAPRSRWTGSQIAWQDGTWVMALGLEGPSEAIVARVDPVTGSVASVTLVPREPPDDGG